MSRRPPLSSLANHAEFGMPMSPVPTQPKSLHHFSAHTDANDAAENWNRSPMAAPVAAMNSVHPNRSGNTVSTSSHQQHGHLYSARKATSASSPSALFLQNTTPHDRRLLAKKSLILQIGRSRAFGLVGSGRKRYFWRSPFIHKEKRIRMLLIRHSSVYPVLSRHLAARMIQHWWHRFTPEQRTKRSRRKLENAQQRGMIWTHPYTVWKDVAQHAARIPRRRTPTLAAAYYLETGQYATQLSGTSSSAANSKAYTLAYKDWCAGKIQRSWLHWYTSRRYRNYTIRPVYIYAAVDIQRCYREYRRRKAERGDPLMHLNQPARVIQRAYKRFTQRRIYQYFRDLILSRQNSNPYLLLKMLQPREALTANDHASGLYLRFRLGGNVFPPILYYKTFTHFNVTDINAFAPRDYARDRKMEQEKRHVKESNGAVEPELNPTDRAYWYRRYENNGWRPIVNDSFLASRDPVYERTTEKKFVFHPNKMVRRMEVLKRRKEKKIEWLKKIYSSGVVKLPEREKQEEESKFPAEPMDSDEEEWEAWKNASAARLPGLKAGSRSPEELLSSLEAFDSLDTRELLAQGADWEKEADELLSWTQDLVSFEEYHNTWLVQATSRPNEKEYRVYDQTVSSQAPRTLPIVQEGAMGNVGKKTTASLVGSAQAASHASSKASSKVTLAPSASAQLRAAEQAQRDADSGEAMDLAAQQAAAEEWEEENDGLPEFLQRTASRAQLASLQASQRSLQSMQSQASLISSAASSSNLAQQQQLEKTRSKAYDVTQVRLTPAVATSPSSNSTAALASRKQLRTGM